MPVGFAPVNDAAAMLRVDPPVGRPVRGTPVRQAAGHESRQDLVELALAHAKAPVLDRDVAFGLVEVQGQVFAHIDCGRGECSSVNLRGETLLAIDGLDLLRREARRKHHFEHFDIVAVTELAMADVGRLVHAGSSLQTHHALAFVLELDPALEHIDELKARLVKVRLARKLLAGGRTDDVSIDAPVGSRLDAEVTVLVERTQAAFEMGILGVRCNEALGGHGWAGK